MSVNAVNVKSIPLTTLEGIASTQAFAGNAQAPAVDKPSFKNPHALPNSQKASQHTIKSKGSIHCCDYCRHCSDNDDHKCDGISLFALELLARLKVKKPNLNKKIARRAIKI